jgi:hypothetical protein
MVELSGGQDGFKILQVKFDAESQCPHHIFFKNHNVKAGCSKIDILTLFWPIFLDNLQKCGESDNTVIVVKRRHVYSLKLA